MKKLKKGLVKPIGKTLPKKQVYSLISKNKSKD
jgi:hypothetical protein